MFQLKTAPGGLVRVTRSLPAFGVTETWLSTERDAEATVLRRWSVYHREILGYAPPWPVLGSGSSKRLPVEIADTLD